MLGVVYYKQQLAFPKVREYGRHQRLLRNLANVERLGDRVLDKRGIGEAAQIDEPRAVRESLEQLRRDLQGEPGLADAAYPRERNDSPLAQQFAQFGDLAIPSDKARGLVR